MAKERGSVMSLAVIDAREWQSVFDLRTGQKSRTDNPAVNMVKEVLARHPYPGDTGVEGNRWVTDTALDLIMAYDPRLVMLTYASQYFTRLYSSMDGESCRAMISSVFEEVNRFVRVSGFEYILVGTGDLVPLAGYIELSKLDGLGVLSRWSARYAGLYGPSARDLSYLLEHPYVERVAKRRELVSLLNATQEEEGRVPEYLIVAKEGYTFRAAAATLRKALMVPGPSFHVPLSTVLGQAPSLTDIAGLAELHLAEKKVALIVLEGIGVKNFLWPWSPCNNGREWFYYEPGDGQYLAITAGEHRAFEYPVGYRYFEEDGPDKEYPFSGYFRSLPKGVLGDRFPGRSIAVGNKSMMMHTVTGADISIECFARNLYNQGTMAAIHRSEKFQTGPGKK